MSKQLLLTTVILLICCPAICSADVKQPAFDKLQLSDQFYCEGAYYADFNRDGKPDVVAGPYWYEGPEFTTKHEIYPPVAFDPVKYSDVFLVFTGDFNGDGWADVFYAPFPGKEAYWYENPADKGDKWKKHFALKNVGNESPTWSDLDGDGRPNLIYNIDDYLGYATYDPARPDQPWKFHPVSPKLKEFRRFTHGLGCGDINGDGRADIIRSNGWWEQPGDLTDDKPWAFHPYDFAEAAAQLLVYDIDGDGLNDVVTSWHCHKYGLLWYRQTRNDKNEISWQRNEILSPEPDLKSDQLRISQLHAQALADVSGDGLLDIVTGKRFWSHGPTGDVEPNAPAVVYWFELQRRENGEPKFVPHQIDDNSGVGTQVTTADVNGDKIPDVIVGNKKGTFIHLSRQSAKSRSSSAKPVKASPDKPNVVFVFADQWRAQATGFAGDPNAKTPCLDRLASQGIALTTAVSSCPVCSPYRASLITGQYPLTHGVFLNDVLLGQKATPLPEPFKQAGYTTAYIGKWHLDGPKRSGFIPPERRQGFEFWRACECTHNYNKSLYYGDTDEKLYWKGYDAVAQTEAAADYIREHRQQPFLLVLSWGPPHNPYQTAPRKYRDMFKPEDMVLRPNVPKEEQESARRDLAGYYAHCAALDQCVGDLMDVLEECGLADDTILVVTSDHGDMLGSHGQHRKQVPWDESILVPFVVRWPNGLKPAGARLSAPIASHDIMPTLLGLCGLEIPKSVEGLDRSPWLRGNEPDDDRAALLTCPTPFGEWKRDKGGREYRGLRTKRYTYVRSLDGPWLLFDNQEDPYQMRNLVGDPQYADVERDLDAQLQKELKRRADEFRPGAEYIREWGYKTDKTGTVPYQR